MLRRAGKLVVCSLVFIYFGQALIRLSFTNMLFDSSVDVFDAIKSSFPISFFVFILPLLLAISPVNGAQSFPVYRVNQFDLAGNNYGEFSIFARVGL